jgi:glycosyltransferase involved in cell wall biosynthesis
MDMNKALSIVIPAKNEASNLDKLLPRLRTLYKEAEIIVVDDGSTDNTSTICEENSVRLICHPYSKGNGAAIKTGAQAAMGEVIIFMDADGQHKPEDIEHLLHKFERGYHMVIGARNAGSHASLARRIANGIYNTLSSWMTGQQILDLTSGFRAVNARKFREFLHMLPNGFSYPTTITMAFFRAGYSVGYQPIEALKRGGKSHIKPLKDGIRFLLIIFRVGTLYSPLKIFIPISLLHFMVGISYYFYTYISSGRFTNMSALLLTTSVIIFLIGLVSEQITTLIYSRIGNDK